MTSGETALVISGASLAIALGSLLWNVWEKFVFVKPRLQVTFGVFRVYQGGTQGPQLLSVGVTNMGPGPTIIHSCVARINRWWFNKKEYALLNPIHGDPTSPTPTSLGPFSAGLPLKIEPGEMQSFYFPFSAETFLSQPIEYVGVHDTYGRYFWCKRRAVRRAKKQFEEAFGSRENAR